MAFPYLKLSIPGRTTICLKIRTEYLVPGTGQDGDASANETELLKGPLFRIV
jgi:hypothetical protein